MAIKLTIHSTGVGTCALTGKETEGLTVTFEEGTIKNSFLSWKAFRQILGMLAVQNRPVPQAMPVSSNGGTVTGK